MGWVTTLGPDLAQVEYRLEESAGCAADVQTDYRLAESQSTLEWVGSGLAEVGIQAGAPFAGDADKDRARALMNGADPRTGDALVAPKRAVDPRAKLSAAPLVDAVRAAAQGQEPAEAFEDPRRQREWHRLVRGVTKDEGRYRVDVTLLSRVAVAAGVDLADVYGTDELAAAREHAAGRVTVGNRGYDLTVDIPKSYSVLQAVADEELSAAMDRIFRQSVRETVGAVETWAGWAQRGKQGEGRLAARIETTGVLGWSMTHYTARPVDGQAPDPHLHAHITLANMVRGVDGRWSAVGGGGRDLHRHAVAANAYLEARIRARSAEELGLQWHRDPRTGIWEVAAVPAAMREVFSKRGAVVEAAVAAEDKAVSTRHHHLIAARTREAKGSSLTMSDLRAEWRRQAAEAGFDVAGVERIATARGFVDEPVREAEAIAARIWHPQEGLTSHQKAVSRADVLAAVADAAPGVASVADLERLADEVLAVPGYTLRLDTDLPGTFTHSERYTTVDIAEAEQTILAAARERLNEGAAAVDADTAAAAIEAFELGHGFELSEEQRAVVERLATAGHGLDAVIGVAGSGKTTIMEALAGAHYAAGHTVAGASTAAVAAHHLQTETGIPSSTIASWLGRIERGPGLAGVDVLVIDEAAMVDDRQYARLVTAAAESGTQLVGIGDPKQLHSPGVGSAFSDVHQAVDGLTLTDNRRQQHEAEVQALARWRDDDRRAIFDALATRDAVHAEERLEGVWSAMIGSWWAGVRDVPDAHDRIEQHLMIAATNSDVDTLNHAAQAIRIDAGELAAADGRDYRIEGGRALRIHVGDVVAARSNDYSAGVLNGYRGTVTAIDEDGALTVAIREHGPDGPEVIERRVGERYVRTGHLELGYAITGHRAQGQTAQTVHASLTGMDAHAAYAALTRHRERVDVWLAADVVEDEATRARLGEPGTDAERIERAVDAYVDHLNRPERDPLVLADLAAHRGDLLAHREAPPLEPPDLSLPGSAEPATNTEEPQPRPYEGLSARELVDAYTSARQAERDAEQRLTGAQARHEAHARALTQYGVDRAAAHDGRGPEATKLSEQRQALTTAAAALTDAQAHRERYEELGAATSEDYRTGSAALTRAKDNPIKLRLQGTSRDEQQQIATEAYARIGARRDEQLQAETAQRETQGRFRAVQDQLPRDGYRVMQPHQVEPARAELEAHWTERHTEAVAADIAAVREPRPPEVNIDDAAARLDQARAAHESVADEVRHRSADPQARAEIQAANEELRRELQEAAAARQAEQRQRQRTHRAPRYDPSADQDHDIGGFSR